jgi:DNA polymerase
MERHDSIRALSLGLARWLEQERRRGIVYAPWQVLPIFAEIEQMNSASGVPAPSEPAPVHASPATVESQEPKRDEPVQSEKNRPISVAASGSPADLKESAALWDSATKLEYLRTKVVGDCQRCPLSKTRNHLVFGVGSAQAKLMIVGEAPGADEDRRGEPFVGAAGQRLNEWLASVGLARSDVYIANVLKCRPPQNRDPDPSEIAKCSPFLRAQIRAIEPRVLLALGRFAGSLLLGRADERLHRMRRETHVYRDAKASELAIPVIVTYHPSYVLRAERSSLAGRETQQSNAQKEVLSDFQRVLEILRS